METIIFIGSNKSGTSRDALITSAKMGFYTVLFTNRKKFMRQRNEFPEVNKMIFLNDLLEEEMILHEIKKLQENGCEIRGCMSFIDPYVSFSAKLSKELGLVYLSAEALNKIEEKTRVREMLKDEPYSPFFSIFHFDKSIQDYAKDLEDRLPLILKSPVSNGSKDVLLVHTISEFRKGLKHLRSKFPTIPVLIEEYLRGPQYLIEVMVYNNSIHVVAVIEQEILSSERFIITGYLLPGKLSKELMDKLENAITSIIRHLDLSNGNCHLEFRMVDGAWKLIEVNPRMSGGAMNKIIFEGKGINLVEEIIKLNIGKEPILTPLKDQFVYAKFITIGSKGRLIKVTGKNRAAQCEGIKDVFVKPRKGSILSSPNSLGDRYAYVIAAGETAEQARKYALRAAQEIKFYLEPL